MIRVPRLEEPAGFDERRRKRGQAWLACHPETDPHKNPLWNEWRPQLWDLFQHRCGYLAMFAPVGSVDHWISTHTDRALAYEWSNYRLVEQCINSSKKPFWEGRLLDPFEVEEDWFEVLLPSLQLVIGNIPDPSMREKAEFTLEKLHLRDGEAVIRIRRAWMELHEAGELKLEGLRRVAPLLARAIEKRDQHSAQG